MIDERHYEIANRLMKAAGVEAILAFSNGNIFYLTGDWLFEGFYTFNPHLAVLPLGGRPILIAPPEEEDFITSQHIIEGCKVIYYDRPLGTDPMKSISATLTSLGLASKKVGIDATLAPFRLTGGIRRETSAKLIDVSSIFAKLRSTKTDSEIRKLRRSTKINEKAFLDAYAAVHEGMTEVDFARIYRLSVTSNGGSVTFVEMGADPNGKMAYPTEYKIKHGDAIHIDAGASYEHYQSDTSRIAVVGSASETVRKIHEALTDAELKGIQMLKPGVDISDVCEACANAVLKIYPSYEGWYFGHNIGIDTHESPLIQRGVSGVLEANMVVCVEVGYFLPGLGLFNTEDTVLIKEEGHELLSALPHELFVLGTK